MVGCAGLGLTGYILEVVPVHSRHRAFVIPMSGRTGDLISKTCLSSWWGRETPSLHLGRGCRGVIIRGRVSVTLGGTESRILLGWGYQYMAAPNLVSTSYFQTGTVASPMLEVVGLGC